VYSSGSFFSYTTCDSPNSLRAGRRGIPRVKMKVGREPERDVQRVRVAREAIGHKRLDEKSGLALIDPGA
jgi:L-alanine-DL-glutamate epimerase-like enolase superfamily enzyme